MRERLVWVSVLILISLTTGCGRDGGTQPSSVNQPQSEAPSTNPPSTSEPPVSIPESDPTPVTQTQNYAVSITGSQVVTQQVEAGSILLLTLKPMPNANSDYGCVNFEVTIGASTFQTGILKVEGIETGNCPQAPTQFEMDYSHLLSSGANTLDVSIRALSTDRSCYVFGFRCPAFSPQPTEFIQGELIVTTNEPGVI